MGYVKILFSGYFIVLSFFIIVQTQIRLSKNNFRKNWSESNQIRCFQQSLFFVYFEDLTTLCNILCIFQSLMTFSNCEQNAWQRDIVRKFGKKSACETSPLLSLSLSPITRFFDCRDFTAVPIECRLKTADTKSKQTRYFHQVSPENVQL